MEGLIFGILRYANKKCDLYVKPFMLLEVISFQHITIICFNK